MTRRRRSTHSSHFVGIDIGGTFTDVVLLESNGHSWVHKVLTTLEPAAGALRGLQEVLDRTRVQISRLELVIHSTTLVTNAITEARGVATGLITTNGFRDILEMRHEHRYDIYDLFLGWPEPLVPRQHRLGVAERTASTGEVLLVPDEREVEVATAQLIEAGVQAIAVCLLHSYKNDDNERRVESVIRRVAPNVHVSLSSDVAPQIREYERTSTTVADAYVSPLVESYLADMQTGLEDMGFSGQFLLMLSGGGAVSAGTARQRPIQLTESGPAAGATAGGMYATMTSSHDALSFDMGGTTAKVCVLRDGVPHMVNSLEVARTKRFMRGSGLPLLIPSVELIEIGAGGGSIAHVDKMGLLKVGPGSAGSTPGPACYGLGGTKPTVTDANLVLGYLNADYFLGGRMKLDTAAALTAIEHLQLQLTTYTSALEVAWGIHQVVNENMAQAALAHFQEKSVDPRRVTMIAFGGAAPAHAALVANRLGITRIVIPLGAGATSALGCLAAPLTFHFGQSLVGTLDDFDWSQIEEMFITMESRGLDALCLAGVAANDVYIERSVDCRVYGQLWEIAVPLPRPVTSDDVREQIAREFAASYQELYRRYPYAAPIEAVNWKVMLRGPRRRIQLQPPALSAGRVDPKGHRKIFSGERKAMVEAPVYDRYAIPMSTRLEGPCVVEERETTFVLPEDWIASVDEHSNLIAVHVSVDGASTAGRAADALRRARHVEHEI